MRDINGNPFPMTSSSKWMPKIKPLVWEDQCRHPSHSNVLAETPWGNFEVVVKQDGAYVLSDPKRPLRLPEFNSESEAKAWCEAEYERRVKECLE
jgi:hypothetical protein